MTNCFHFFKQQSLTTFMNNPTGDTPWEEEPGAETVRHVDGDEVFFPLYCSYIITFIVCFL